MAHFRLHHPLDDDELRMSLDDDMHALEALGAEDHGVDVDMDMDAVEGLDDLDDHQQLKQEQRGVNRDDGDVFRPSAMLDRRMEEEFGGAFYSTCLQASELVEKDLDGGFVDIEQMLLSESEEFLTAHFANTSDDQLHAQLLDGTNSGDQSDQINQINQRQRMIRAEITARHFLHAKRNANGDNDSDTAQLQQQRLVLLKQAIASSSLSSSSIFNMPPKYFEGGVQSSPQKRRAYRRTFGERTQPFAFGSSNTYTFKQEDHQPGRMTSDCFYQIGNSSSGSPFNDENCPPYPSITPSDEVRIKEEVVDIGAHLGVSRVGVHASESETESMDEGHGDEEELKAAAGLENRAQTPVTLAPFTGFRSISDDHQYNNDNDEEEMRTTLRTPLRRSLSSPAPSQAANQHYTPLQQQHLSGGYASRSMSPADAFEKVAVVLQVAKDSPGRVDKFEWRIGGSAQTQQQQQGNTNGNIRKRPNLSAQLGKSDAILSSTNDDSRSCPSSELDESKTSTTANANATATLPPRYFRGVTSSPQKRRAHSTTFGSFARSFSFTGSSGPPSDL